MGAAVVDRDARLGEARAGFEQRRWTSVRAALVVADEAEPLAPADLELLAAIQELTTAGVNLEGVRRIMQLRRDSERLRYQVTRLRRIIEAAQADGGTAQVIELAVRRRNLPDVQRD